MQKEDNFVLLFLYQPLLSVAKFLYIMIFLHYDLTFSKYVFPKEKRLGSNQAFKISMKTEKYIKGCIFFIIKIKIFFL